MPNIGVFSQICVLHDFREKKLKSNKKQQMGPKIRVAAEKAKLGSADCHNSVTMILNEQSSRKNVATELNNVAT